MLRVKRCDDLIGQLFAAKLRQICHSDAALKYLALTENQQAFWTGQAAGEDRNYEQLLNKSCTNHCSFIIFHKIQQKHVNSAVKGKFHGSARNSVARRKLWALVITICANIIVSQNVLNSRALTISNTGRYSPVL